MQSIQIHPDDNVAVSLQEGNDIPRGHKFALRTIEKGELIVKYGMPIGHALREIAKGEHVHTHNMATNLEGTLEYSYTPEECALPAASEQVFFQGFRRSDGHVGIRNHIFLVPTVGCVNQLARKLAEAMNRELAEDGPIDHVLALEHPYGCSQLGSDHVMTQEILAGLAKHPNAGGVLILALGCENNTLASFQQKLGSWDAARMKFLVAQDSEDEISDAMTLLRELADTMRNDVREAIPLSELIVGFKCGGSDGLSGVTANPLIGRFSDALVAHGASSILTEVPEMFGAETLLMKRCRTRKIFDHCVTMINDFKRYFLRYGQPVGENPSPGNKEGGISTLEDKSMGCTQKSGSSPVEGVLRPGEQVTAKGLNLLTGPGNDMVSATLLAASGAHLILFSTGRGTPFGSIVPTLKIATNSALAQKKRNWIDFDAGRLLTEKTPHSIDREFFDLVLATASGQETANERARCEEIAIFKDGVTL
ncbi:MAG: altronate dehydratase family protein [Victivallaceae bacterium]|nr:altronate dehydratase family protein [Victivallaceae bacterium]